MATAYQQKKAPLNYHDKFADFFVADVPAHRYVMYQRAALVKELLDDYPDASSITVPEWIHDRESIVGALKVLYGEYSCRLTVKVIMVLDYLTKGTFNLQGLSLDNSCFVRDLLEAGADYSVALCDDLITRMSDDVIVQRLRSKELATRHDFALLRKLKLGPILNNIDLSTELADALVEFFQQHPPETKFKISRGRDRSGIYMQDFDKRLRPYVTVETYYCGGN